jgi:serine protease Do
MKRIFLILILILTISLLSSCSFFDTGEDEPPTLSVESVYAMACDAGYQGTLDDFIAEFKGTDGAPGGDGLGIKSVAVDGNGHLIITYTNDGTYDAGLVIFTPDYSKITPSIAPDGNWYIGGVDTGIPSNASEGSEWYADTGVPSDSLGFDGDFFVSTTTLNVYYKNGGWLQIGSLKEDTYEPNASSMSEKAISRALLSSVSIFCETYSGGISAGSGVIYKLDKTSGDAYVITNHHVIYDDEAGKIVKNENIEIYLYGLEYTDYKISVSLVGASSVYDIALLKISASDVIKSSSARPAVIADSDEVSKLDAVVAIGNPFGYGIAATSGSVSVESEFLDDNDSQRLIRTDAAVNEGNSGGGLFNSDGELIGIVTSKLMSQKIDNVAYAVVSNQVSALVENMLYFCNGTSKTSPKKIIIGITYEIEEVSVNYNEESGAITITDKLSVTSVAGGSYAYSMGIETGDFITKITVDGTEYGITRLYQLRDIILNVRPDSNVKFTVLRDGDTQELSFTAPSEYAFSVIE